MLNSKAGHTLLISLGLCIVASFIAVGCGDTGGDPKEAGLGSYYFADGAAGGNIAISVKGDLKVGETVGFSVTLNDPRGEPLSYVRVNCDTEKGLSILEPAEGGVAYEHTNAEGMMSGLLGGLAEGSYIIECRAPVEYNLMSRATIVVRGSAPENFQGWPGAAGGNLGGGRIIVPDVDTGAVRITEITYQDLGEDTLYLDTVQDPDCDPDTAGDQIEPFYFKTYTIKIANDSLETVFIDSIDIVVQDGRDVNMTQAVDLQIAPGGTASYTGQLTENGLLLAGTSVTAINGTYPLAFTIKGETADSGDSFSVTESQTVTWANVDNCDS